jgi:hypothetical protein
MTEGIMNHEATGLMEPLELDASELNDLRCLRAAEGYAELGMYDEAAAEIENLSATCRLFRLFFMLKPCGHMELTSSAN